MNNSHRYNQQQELRTSNKGQFTTVHKKNIFKLLNKKIGKDKKKYFEGDRFEKKNQM